MVRCREPPLLPAFTIAGLLSGLVENDCRAVATWGRAFVAVMRVRWHSFRTDGIEDAGRREGIEKAWISEKRFDA